MFTTLPMSSRDIVQCCPVCGRLLHIGVHLSGQTVTCGHCRGRFVASAADDLTRGLTGRVDRLLGCASHVPDQPCDELQRAHRLPLERSCDQVFPTVPSAASKPVAEHDTACMATGSPVARIKTVLLVEHRDEVFAQLSAPLAEARVLVERVCAAHGVRRHLARHRPELAIVNMDTPDESGWLLASKLRLGSPATRIWLYASRSPSPTEQHFSRFLEVELVQYPGDLISLAAEILRRVLNGGRLIREDEPSGSSPESFAKAI